MTFANPYIFCVVCGVQVTDSVDLVNTPCGHRAPWETCCASWGPVDGCTCEKAFGYLPHDESRRAHMTRWSENRYPGWSR